MSNALAEIRTQVQAALAAGVTAAKWVDAYDGEDWNDESFKAIRSRVALKGSGLYVRLPTVVPGGDAEGATFDHVEVYCHVLACAAAVANRESAAVAAESLAWSAYSALLGAGKVPDFMHTRWMAPQFLTEHQSPNCTMISLTMSTSVDLAEVDETIATPDDDVPSAAKGTPVDADRLTLWDSADAWARRYLTWAAIKSTLKVYFDTLYATLVHASRHASAGADPVTPAAIGAEPAQVAASEAEAEAGTETGLRSWSPLRVKQAIVALGGAIYAALVHASRHAAAGADPVTPAAIGAEPANANLQEHVTGTGSPHTAEGVGAATAAHTHSGSVGQVLAVSDGAAQSTSAAMQFDQSVPQINEGAEYTALAITITPKNAGSTLVLDLNLLVASNSTAGRITAALFADAIADALAAGFVQHGDSGSTFGQAYLLIRVAIPAGSTAPRTYHVRYGASTRFPLAPDPTLVAFVNSNGAGPVFGGTAFSSFVITEVLP